MKGLILAGGLGKRLRPLTHTGPKQLIPIANKPVMYYAMEHLKNAGITDVGMIVGYTGERINKIKDAMGDGSHWDAKITYIEQDAPRGIAHAIGIAEDFIGNEPFLVYLGDNMLKGGVKEFVNNFLKSDCDASILLSESKTPEKFGVAELDGGGRLIGVEEKPKPPKSNLVVTGIYLFRPSVFKVIKDLQPSWRNEFEITTTIDKMIKSSEHKVSTHVVDGWWDDAGGPGDVLRANRLILDELKPYNKGQIEKDVKLIGKIAIGEGTIIKSGSVIRGPVIIGKNCEVGPKTYIGPYTSVGDNTKIINGEIESSIIIGDTVIEINGKIVDSLIGRHSNIVSSDTLPKGYKFIVGENSSLSL